MRIISEPKTFDHFCELSPGDVFCYDGNWFMKIDMIRSENLCLNAVDLDTGALYYILSESEVEYQDVELRAHEF